MKQGAHLTATKDQGRESHLQRFLKKHGNRNVQRALLANSETGTHRGDSVQIRKPNGQFGPKVADSTTY